MRYKFIITFILLTVSFSSKGDINWYRVSANTLIVADWLQTSEIASNERFYETNRMLGRDPSQGDVNKHFVTNLLLTNIIGELFPEKYKDYFYISISVVSANYVLNNYTLGVRIKL